MRLWKLIRQLWRRRNFEAALAEEVSFHREMAGAAFGSVALTLEDSRAVWGFGRLDSLAQDVRYAARGFRKTPGFALTVIGTIGLGLGLNTTLFAVFNAYALRPYALQDPYRLYTFSWTTRSAAWHDFTWPEFQALDRQNTAFAGVLAYRDMIAALNGNASFGQLVTGNYFNTLGAGIVMGRPLVAEDSASAGTGPVMVLSFRAWQNKFGGDPGILGRKVFLRGQPFEVVGVASPEFVGLEPTAVDYWVPLTMAEAVSTGSGQLPPIRMVGRLKRGVTPEAAKTALLAWSRAITAEYPQDQQAAGITLMSRATPAPLTPNVLLAMSPIFAAFALVLLISCANVSNMLGQRSPQLQQVRIFRDQIRAGLHSQQVLAFAGPEQGVA